MSLNFLDHDVDKIGLDCIQEALWPTLVTTALDRFPTNRFTTNSRLKGIIDFRGYTSSGQFPLIGYEITGASAPEVATLGMYTFRIEYIVKIAHRGVFSHSDATNTAGRRMVVRDLHRAQVALASIDDARLTYGAYGIAHSTLITGKESGRTYCIGANPVIGEMTVYKATTEEGGIDSLGVDIWVGTFPGEMTIHVQ